MKLFTEVHQINLRVRDMDRSCKWYQEVLGLSILKDYGSTVVLGFNKISLTSICLIELPNEESFPNNNESGTHPVIAISPDHAETCKETLQGMGIEIVEGGGMAHFKFKDPDGNLIEAYIPGLYEEDRFKNFR